MSATRPCAASSPPQDSACITTVLMGCSCGRSRGCVPDHFRTTLATPPSGRGGAGKLQSARGRLQGLPLAMKLDNMRGDLEQEKAQLEGKNVDEELQHAAADIDATAAALRTATLRVSEMRRERDRLAAATQAATRVRVAQESAADLQAQVSVPHTLCGFVLP